MRKKIFTKYLKLVNLYFPFLGAGIRLRKVNKDRTSFYVSTRLTWRNKNLFGTQFGGSLYAMTDPFYAFILVLNLGDEYIVWDKSAHIEFKKPGRGKVFAELTISKEKIAEIKEEVDKLGKNTYNFETDITDQRNNVIAAVNKELYVRKKNYNQ